MFPKQIFIEPRALSRQDERSGNLRREHPRRDVSTESLSGFSVGEGNSASSRALQRAMNGASVPHEVGAGPGERGEEIVWEQVALQLVAADAREDDVRGMVHPAVRERIYVVEGRRLEIERSRAVDAAAATVSHGHTLDGALVSGSAKIADARAARPGGAAEAGGGKHDAVTLSSNGHFTSREKTTPRAGRNSRGRASNHLVVLVRATNGTRHCRARAVRLENRRCRTSGRASDGVG